MFDFMQYALIFYDFQLILAQMPAHREQERRDRDRLGQPRLERAA
jgi:hypothetical protein